MLNSTLHVFNLAVIKALPLSGQALVLMVNNNMLTNLQDLQVHIMHAGRPAIGKSHLFNKGLIQVVRPSNTEVDHIHAGGYCIVEGI